MKLMKRFLLVHLFLLTLALPSVAWALDSTGFTPLDVTVASTGGSPVGAVLPWPNSTPPDGWLECNGQSFNAATYPDLQTLLGTNQVPDLRGEFIRGWDHGRGIDPGRSLKSWQVDMFKSHTHDLPVDNSEGYTRKNADSGAGHTDGTYESEATGGVETRPRNVAMMYIIKAR